MFRSFLVFFICCVGYSVAYDLGFDPFEIKQECGANEVAAGCINPCPPQKTCQNRENVYCLAVVVPCQFQCHCKEGYIRKVEDGECIPVEECGPYCGRNEVYTDCKPSCQSEPCFATKEPSNCVNEEPCKPGCICKEGYLRAEDDTACVPRCLCPELFDTQECSAYRKEHQLIYNY